MKSILILIIALGSQFALADELVSSKDQLEFVKKSVNSVFQKRDPEMSVVADSLKLTACTGLNKMGTTLSNWMQSGKGECHIVQFQAYDKQSRKFYTGEVLLFLGHKVRRQAGLISQESDIPQFSILSGETQDKTGKTVVMGIHAMNYERTEKQTAADLFDMRPAPSSGNPAAPASSAK